MRIRHIPHYMSWLARPASLLSAMAFCAVSAHAAPASSDQSHLLASGTDALTDGARLCTHYMPRYERQYAIPVHLLAAIASTESGRWHDRLRLSLPWPWTINANGKSYYYENKEEAIAGARRMLKAGTRSIDVGCMQVNLQHHPSAFASLDEAFEPEYNVAYAATFLRSLYDEQHSWHAAAAAYHSKTPDLGATYVGQVYDRWNTILERIRVSRQNLARSMGAVATGGGLTRAEAASAQEASGGRYSGHMVTTSSSKETAHVLEIQSGNQESRVEKRAEKRQFASYAARDTGPLLIRPQEQIRLSTAGAPPIPEPVAAVTPVAIPKPNAAAVASSNAAQQVVQGNVPPVAVQPSGVTLADAQAAGNLAPSAGQPTSQPHAVNVEYTNPAPRKQGPRFIFSD